MAYLETGDLRSWANGSDAAASLPGWVERIIKLGLLNHPEMRFLRGAFNGLPGVDGWIRGAQVRDELKPFIPEGDSIWEFSVQAAAKTKVKSDAAKRLAAGPTATRAQAKRSAKKKVGGTKSRSKLKAPSVWTPETTTIVFITPRGVADVDALQSELKKKAKWKEVRVIDGQRLFDWLQYCPAAALSWASEIHGVDSSTLKTFDMAWDEVAGTTSPKLTKDIIIAGRDDARSRLKQQLKDAPQHIFVKGDSEFEALTFALSVLQDDDLQTERARTLVAPSYEAAVRARALAPSIFIVGADRAATSALNEKHKHHVVVAYGDPIHSPFGAIELDRPLRWNFAKGLESAGLGADEADRLARECGSSVTVLCRRRPSGQFAVPWWASDPHAALIRPLTLLGRWNASNTDDRTLLKDFSAREWDDLQQDLLNYINRDNAPLVREGQVWALGSHVDSFVILAPRLGDADIKRFVRLVRKVFEPSKAIEAGNDLDDVFRVPTGVSEWMKNGVAQTLLLLAVRGPFLAPTLSCPIPFPGETDKWRHGPPNELVDALLAELPALASFPRLYQSIKDQFLVLIEASPDPLLEALEQWLEGKPDEVAQMLLTKRGFLQEWPDVTELLWGLEALAWSPDYVLRIARILATMASLEQPQEARDTNRPLEALARIVMWWSPQTFAPLAERISVVDAIVAEFPEVGWALLLQMRPTGSMIQWPTAKPRMRDFAPPTHEVLTRRVVFEGLLATIQQIFAAASHNASRWVQIVEMMSHFPLEQREEARLKLISLIDTDLDTTARTSLWEALRDEIARHRTYAKTDWALQGDELRRWDEVLASIAPTDPVVAIKWLFDDWLPDLDDELEDLDKVQDRIERRREEALRSLLDKAGPSGVLRLAETSKFPNFVGSSLGIVLRANREVRESIAKMALSDKKIDIRFVATLLWSSLKDTPEAISSSQGELYQLATWALSQNAPADRIAPLLTWLPTTIDSWALVTSLGKNVEDAFWRVFSPPLQLADSEALKFMTGKLISTGRAFELGDVVAFGKIPLEPEDALRVLDAIIQDLSSTSATTRAIPRHLREFLGYLSRRQDIKDLDLARREILLVPALGYHHGLDLRLFKVLGEEPTLFMDLICQIYRPDSERGKPSDTDEATRNLANRAFRLLASWHHQMNPRERRRDPDNSSSRPFPAERPDGTIDAARLMSWVATARARAKEADRVATANNEIGQVLAYSPVDPDDGAWPIKAVRDVIEKHYSKDLQAGLLNEYFNKRGVHGVVEGGKEEQVFSDDAKRWAAVVKKKWPRTNSVLIALAKMWEHDRDRAIEWEKQRRLQERL